MPLLEEACHCFDNSPLCNNQLKEGYRMERSQSGVMFSGYNNYNVTSLAVQHSLKEIFDEFHVMIAGELKDFDLEENDESEP